MCYKEVNWIIADKVEHDMISKHILYLLFSICFSIFTEEKERYGDQEKFQNNLALDGNPGREVWVYATPESIRPRAEIARTFVL